MCFGIVLKEGTTENGLTEGTALTIGQVHIHLGTRIIDLLESDTVQVGSHIAGIHIDSVQMQCCLGRLNCNGKRIQQSVLTIVQKEMKGLALLWCVIKGHDSNVATGNDSSGL